MKVATVRQLRNEYTKVLAWVESGEEVRISKRGRFIARLVPERLRTDRVDWTKSAAFGMDRSKFKKLNAREAQAVLEASRGET